MRDSVVLGIGAGAACAAYVVWRSASEVHRKQGVRPFIVDLFRGGCEYAVAKTCTAPLELLRLKAQLQPSMPTGGILAAVVDQHGVLGLWGGNTIEVLRYFPVQLTNFLLKDAIKALLPKYDAKRDFTRFFAANMASRALAGGWSLLFVYPLDMARTLLAVRPDFAPDAGTCIRRVYEQGGISGLYSGFGISVVGIALFRGTHFGVYDFLKTRNPYKKDKGFLGLFSKFCIAQSTAVIAGFISYPCDSVRRHMQMNASHGCNDATWHVAAQLLRTRGLFGGFGFIVARQLGGAVVLVAYDEIKTLDGWNMDAVLRVLQSHGHVLAAVSLALSSLLADPGTRQHLISLLASMLRDAGTTASFTLPALLASFAVSHALPSH